MSKKYHIREINQDFFLAAISVYPKNVTIDFLGQIFQLEISGYGYTTVLKKEGDHYNDLINKGIRIEERPKDSTSARRTIDYMEPLHDYFQTDAMKKDTIHERKILKKAKEYYPQFHKHRLSQIEKRAAM